MSLVTVTCAAAYRVLSAWLVARTSTVAGDGRSAGAVYSPAAEIVPRVALPPATPFTVQETAASVVPLTVAVNACVLPKRMEALPGVRFTVTAGGGEGGGEGGGGATGLAPPPPQPSVHALAVRRTRNPCAATIRLRCSERGGMPARKAGEGPANVEEWFLAAGLHWRSHDLSLSNCGTKSYGRCLAVFLQTAVSLARILVAEYGSGKFRFGTAPGWLIPTSEFLY